MSIARHHAEWLSLIDQSGPFLSVPVLMRAFPQGLDKSDADLKREMRLAYDEWFQQQRDPAIHTAWIQFVLSQLLEYPKELIAEGQTLPSGLSALISEQNETLRPDMAIIHSNGNPSNNKPHLLIQKYQPTQKLESAVAGKHWKASPATRMMELLHATDIPLGLVTNGEQWMLVYAPRNEATGFASWYASLWSEEPTTFQAFVSLLSVRRFFGVADTDTLSALLEESSKNQQEVTDQLGLQVRQAVEVLVQVFDRIDQDSGRILLKGVDEKHLYEAALTVMMRLVFLFCAEERKLLPIDEYSLYAQSYAVSNLGAQLREIADKHGEEILERSFDAWNRLLATFRIVYAGVEHDAMRLPPYGGNLFNPDRFPFLEGRPLHGTWRDTTAEPLRIDNRTVLHLLEALQWLIVKIPGGGPRERRRLSFRSLDIEQIGHVYEGLLDHTAVRATDTILGLSGTKGKEPEISLGKLERLLSQGQDDTVEFLKKETGRSVKALNKAIAEPALIDEARLRVSCRNDEELMKRVQTFASLIRDDTFGYPVVISEGSVYVTSGTDRRSSGTHYTPKSLTEPIVRYTLEPLVYEGPADGKPKEQWKLKTACEILELNVCDMAMGSGAFLVQACRYLSERLLEAWENAEKELGGNIQITPEGLRSKGMPEERLVPFDPDERMAIAMRIVAERCLYGVDKNPLAVEMAKLSLWLITLSKGKPFTFLDHALKCGDSLVGADETMFMDWAHGGNKEQITIFDEKLKKLLSEARAKRQELESFEVKDVRDAERKADLLEKAEFAMEWVKQGCNLLIGTLLSEKTNKDKNTQLNSLLIGYLRDLSVPGLEAVEAIKMSGNERAFHWPFEFPEVFERGGFSAFIGNPPFLGGKRISSEHGSIYHKYLKARWNHRKGSADLCAYFFLRAHANLSLSGTFGLLATNTISQGDTREVCLDHMIESGVDIYHAIKSRSWPGSATVVVSVLVAKKGTYEGIKMLDGHIVERISTYLDTQSDQTQPHRLASNNELSHIGSVVLGLGFTLSAREAEELIQTDYRNSEVLFPYLTGKDLNQRHDQSPSRWIINFFDWTLAKAKTYKMPFQIVHDKVYPERKDKPGGYAKRWWQYGRRQDKLYRAIGSLDRVLIRARVSPTNAMCFVPKAMIYSEQTVVFTFDSYAHFALLQSNIHYDWAWKYSSTMGSTTLRYSPTDCFENFPFPDDLSSLHEIGKAYYELRKRIMSESKTGLTGVSGAFHDSCIETDDIVGLRSLQEKLDIAVIASYGWSDLIVEHGFQITVQGRRFGLSEKVRCELLERLLELNQLRHTKECEQGLHDKRAKTQAAKRSNKKKKGYGNTELPL